ncbi:MAG: halocyanin [Euryarchaeota archaeon]|nr:halocyanin [Euryarchaeota archaeon]
MHCVVTHCISRANTGKGFDQLNKGSGGCVLTACVSEFNDDTGIEVGDTVIWENTGSRAHTVTAYDGGQPEGAVFFATGEFDNEHDARTAWYDDRAGSIYTGDRFEHTFETPGEHDYYCVPHERGGMVGRIIVEE